MSSSSLKLRLKLDSKVANSLIIVSFSHCFKKRIASILKMQIHSTVLMLIRMPELHVVELYSKHIKNTFTAN